MMMRHLCMAVLLAVSPAWAEPAPPPDDLEAIAKAASILHMQGGANPLLRDLAEQADDIARSKLPQSPMIEKGKVILFVSASLGDEALKQAFRAGSGDPNVTIVFRGFLPGEKLTDVIKRLGALFGDIDPRPNIAINPKSFRDHRVTVVPTIVELATGKRINGTILAKTFLDRAEQNGGIDLGTVGPVSEIVEPDLTELIKEKAATIDVATRAKEKVASYWRRAPFVDVPKAKERRIRRLDPTVTTENDLRDHEGRLLAPAGTKINPMAGLPFTSRVLIFDGADPVERQWAKDHIKEGRKTILITTRIDRGIGWPAWKTLHESLGLPVYLLQAKLAERFALRTTPTMIEAAPDGVTLLITEDVPTPLENPS